MSKPAMTEPILAPEQEHDALQGMVKILEFPVRPKLVGPDGTAHELTETVYEVLTNLVALLAAGKAVTVMPYDQELTSQQAADILGVSRPHFIKLLDERKIPYTKTGTHRRIRFVDVLNLKHQRNADRFRGLDELEKLGQDLELY
ncbi:MAG TPA: excisionase family DNA-binding protein [Pantanalinema sp.]